MKKIVTTVLATLLAVALCLPGFSAAPQLISFLRADFAQQIFEISLDGAELEPARLTSLELRPGAELELVLAGRDSSLFLDQNGETIKTADVTLSKMRAARFTVSARSADGIAEAELGVRGAGSPSAKPVAIVRFTKNFDSLKAREFDFELSFSIAGKTLHSIEIAGVIANDEVHLVASDSAANISDGSVAVADENIPKVKLDVGCGVVLTASIPKDTRCRAVAQPGEVLPGSVIYDYSDRVSDVLTLTTAGLEGRIRGVHIDTPYTMYAYNADGALLGTTNTVLPFSGQYYLTERKLDIAG